MKILENAYRIKDINNYNSFILFCSKENLNIAYNSGFFKIAQKKVLFSVFLDKYIIFYKDKDTFLAKRIYIDQEENCILIKELIP